MSKIEKPWPFKDKCNELGDQLYCMYMDEEKGLHAKDKKSDHEGCGDLMLEWAKDRFWGQRVQDHIPGFLEMWDILHSHGNAGKENHYTGGDIDWQVWIEPTKDPEDTKVIVYNNMCSGHTFLYILTGLITYGPDYDMRHFYCREIWDKEKKYKGYKFGDFRDIEVPSLGTWRRSNFKFGCMDARDKGHIFSYQSAYDGPKLDKSTWQENRISPALREIRWTLEALRNYERNKC